MAKYDPATIEPKWQQYWAKHETFKVSDDTDKPKYYCLDVPRFVFRGRGGGKRMLHLACPHNKDLNTVEGLN